MTASEARGQIYVLCQASVFPILTNAEVSLLVERARRPDVDNRLPTDAAWIPTWDLAHSIALGWEMKAGKVSTAYDFTSGSQTFNRSTMYKMLMDHAKMWKNKSAYTIALQGSLYARDSRSKGTDDIASNADESWALGWDW